MNPNEFTELKSRIERAKTESIRSQGAIDQIKETWKQEYGFDTLEEAEKKLAEFEQQIVQKTERREILKKQLEEIIPEEWK